MTIGPTFRPTSTLPRFIFAFVLLVAFSSIPLVAQIDSSAYVVSGAHLIDSAFLRDSLTTHRTASNIDAVRRWYLGRGFLDVTVVDDATGIRVVEGRRYRIERIDAGIVGSSQQVPAPIPIDSIRDRLNQGLPADYSDSVVMNRIASLLSWLSTEAYPFAQISIGSIAIDSTALTVIPTVSIDPGALVSIDTILFDGIDRTSHTFLLDRLGDDARGSFDESRLESIREKLVTLNLFDRVDLPQLVRLDSQRYALRIGVVERSANTFDGIIAYQPSTELNEGGYFTGLVRVVLRNLFGSAEWISGRWEKTTRTSSILELGYRHPYIFGLPFGIDFAFSQLQEAETPTIVSWVDRRIDATLLWQLSNRWRVEFGGTYLGLLPAPDTGADPCSPRLIRKSSTLGVQAKVRFDTRVNPANPIRGVFYQAGYRLGRKSSAALSGCDGGGVDAVVGRGIAEIGVEGYLPLAEALVVMGRGSAIDIAGDDVEITELFRLGGLRTIRGYREGAFRIGRGVWGGVEGRLILSDRSYVGPFFDLGYYVTPADTLHDLLRSDDVLFGYGVTMQIDTPLGLSQLSVGLGKGDPIEQAKVSIGLAGEF